MKKMLLFLLSGALMVTACNKGTKEDISNSAVVKTVGKQARPFTGSITYHFATDFDLPCDCGAYYPAGSFYGTGNLSHLGMSSSKIKPCLSPLFSGTEHIGDHVGVECASFVAANGDELYLYTHPYDLMTSGPYGIGTCTADFVGGTGRFASATGSFTGTVTVHAATGTATLTNINGTINY